MIYPELRSRSFIVVNGADEDVAALRASEATGGIGYRRVGLHFLSGPAEVEIVPSDDWDQPNSITAQIQLFARNLGEGKGRQRFDATIFRDPDGGEAIYCGSTVTGGSPKSLRAMPMFINVNEGEIYVGVHGDNQIEFQDRTQKGPNGENWLTVKMPIARLIRHLRRIPK